VSKKPKRIRAVKAHIDQKGGVATTWEAVRDDTPYAPCYILRQSDILAMAEQIEDAWLRKCCEMVGMEPGDFKRDREIRVAGLLHALKSAGMTPGKVGAK